MTAHGVHFMCTPACLTVNAYMMSLGSVRRLENVVVVAELAR